MKKYFVRLAVLILTVACILTAAACTSSSEEVSRKIDVASFFEFPKKDEQDLKYRITDAGTVEIVGYEDVTTRNAIVIPDTIEGKPVTKICNFSLFNTDNLHEITIGKNVCEIGDWALTNNKTMKEFIVDENNQYFCAIDGVLFSKDKKTLICYPTAKNVTIDSYGQTTETTTYVVPEGTEILAKRAFYRCGYLTRVTLPASVTTIGEMCFHRCEKMTTIDVSEGLENIEKDAFTYCTGLTEITLPSTLKKIDTYAFSFCENIKKVVFYAPRAQVTLADKWEPTRDGQKIKDLSVEWKNG